LFEASVRFFGLDRALLTASYPRPTVPSECPVQPGTSPGQVSRQAARGLPNFDKRVGRFPGASAQRIQRELGSQPFWVLSAWQRPPCVNQYSSGNLFRPTYFALRFTDTLHAVYAFQRIPSTVSPSLRGPTSSTLSCGGMGADWRRNTSRFFPERSSTGF
jgi:hypothetical protein